MVAQVSRVLEVYRITLLSNCELTQQNYVKVLEVYRITLLSNLGSNVLKRADVLEVYRITLLSNPQIKFEAQE